MRRILRWVIGLPLAIIVIAFAIANRRWVTLSFDPFSSQAPAVAMDMPLWLLLFIGIFLGLIIGWIAAWIAQGKHRKAAREARSETSKLQTELAELRQSESVVRHHDLVPFNGGII